MSLWITDEVQEDEMGWTYGMDGVEEKRIWLIRGESSRDKDH
jgi:hypothetical protein